MKITLGELKKRVILLSEAKSSSSSVKKRTLKKPARVPGAKRKKLLHYFRVDDREGNEYEAVLEYDPVDESVKTVRISDPPDESSDSYDDEYELEQALDSYNTFEEAVELAGYEISQHQMFDDYVELDGPDGKPVPKNDRLKSSSLAAP